MDSIIHYVEWPIVQVVGTPQLASVSEYECLAYSRRGGKSVTSCSWDC